MALVFYGYATGLFSSRKLEAATYDSIAFRFICANTHPDHDTIATFRRRFLPQLEPLFTAILMLAGEMGFLKLGTVSLDGSKMKEGASKHKALSWGHAQKLEAQLQQEVAELLEMAETTDREEEKAQIEIPAELERRQERLKAIGAAKARIEARAQERYEAEEAAYEAKIEARQAKEEASGKKARGKEPKPPSAGPREKDQVNLTDPESRIMPVSGGGFEQAYNAQVAVDIETLLIVAQFATEATNDKQQIGPALRELAKLPEELGGTETLLADNGFFSEDNVEAVAGAGIEPLIALGREAHHMPLAERMQLPASPGEGATVLDRMVYRLRTPEGRACYGKRKSTVEAVFGQIKRVLGFRQFMLRGFAQISGEWRLVTMAYNIRRLFQLRGGRRGASGTVTGSTKRGPFAGGLLNRWSAGIARRSHLLFPVHRFIPNVT